MRCVWRLHILMVRFTLPTACQQLVLAAAVAFWYFRKPTDSPVGTALCKLVKYHLGSAAKGSILILLFKIPRLILTYLYAKWVYSNDRQVLSFIYALTFRLFSLWSIDWREALMPDRNVHNAVWNHAYAAFGFWRNLFDFWITMRTPWLVSEDSIFGVKFMRFLYSNELS